MSVITTESTYARVKAAYGFRAENTIDPSLQSRISVALGYDPVDTASVPEEANVGEGCGNPLLIANLREGERIVDLGSGGGLDCFLAAKKVGPNGQVIGIDMTEKMIDLARRNASRADTTNVEFFLSNIRNLPLDSSTVDCVISNCVLNLVPEADKPAIFSEIHRVLKPGGRMAISDFLATKPLPQVMRDDLELIAGCVSGAVEVAKVEAYLKAAGFLDVALVASQNDMNLYKGNETSNSVTPCCAGGGSCDPSETSASGRKELAFDLNEWIGSFQIYALKGDIESANTISMKSAAKTPGTENGEEKKCCGCKPGSC